MVDVTTRLADGNRHGENFLFRRGTFCKATVVTRKVRLFRSFVTKERLSNFFRSFGPFDGSRFMDDEFFFSFDRFDQSGSLNAKDYLERADLG